MSKYPAWNYWTFDTNTDGRSNSIYDGVEIAQDDIRHEKYSLRTRKWCLKHYWNAEQAAYISFGRDPDLFVGTKKFLSRDENDPEFLEHIELCDSIKERQRLIDGQDKRILPDFFTPAMFIEWASQVGFSIPDFVTRELAFVERERRGEVKPSVFPGIYFEVDEKTLNDASASTKEADGGQKNTAEGPRQKEIKSLQKVILALLVHSRLDKKDQEQLSKTLSSFLEEKALERGDKQFSVGDTTIQTHLERALDLLNWG
jgi:hypothetical protein